MNTTRNNKQQDDFELFLMEMDDVLSAFIASSPMLGRRLNYSIESLAALESHLLTLPQNASEIEVIKNRSARYLGEVFRHNVGGKWELNNSNPRHLFYGLPVISGYSEKPIQFSPLTIINNFLFRRTQGLLQSAIEANAEWRRK